MDIMAGALCGNGGRGRAVQIQPRGEEWVGAAGAVQGGGGWSEQMGAGWEQVGRVRKVKSQI